MYRRFANLCNMSKYMEVCAGACVNSEEHAKGTGERVCGCEKDVGL